MTIGNIPKEIRRKPSKHAFILLAYLPTTRLLNVSNLSQRRRLLSNLYHSCMRRILEPLETAGTTGVYMTRGDGQRHRIHPIFAAFIGDYPEQILSTGSIYGECPTCNVDCRLLGDYDSRNANQLRDLRSVRTILGTFDKDPAGFLQACAEARIKPIIKPFWINLPYSTPIYSGPSHPTSCTKSIRDLPNVSLAGLSKQLGVTIRTYTTDFYLFHMY